MSRLFRGRTPVPGSWCSPQRPQRLRLPAARAATSDPRIGTLLVGAELACHADKYRFRAILDENRMLAGQFPAMRGQRVSSRLPDVPVVVLSASNGLPGKMRS